MFRLILCALLTASGYMISLELYRGKEAAAAGIYSLGDGFSELMGRISFGGEDVFTAVGRSLGERLPEFNLPRGNFPELWENACRLSVKDPEALRLCLSAGSILGSCGAEEQSDRLRAIRDSLYARSEELRKRAESVKKLYGTLGAATGLAAAIMVI